MFRNCEIVQAATCGDGDGFAGEAGVEDVIGPGGEGLDPFEVSVEEEVKWVVG